MREMFVFNFNALSPDSSVSSNRDQFLCHRVFDNKAATTDHLREVHNNDQTLEADWCRFLIVIFMSVGPVYISDISTQSSLYLLLITN